jgi:dihydropteroate synthase
MPLQPEPSSMPLLWHCGPHRIDLSMPKIMGVVNVTPDSFSDGGRYARHDAALEHAHRLLDQGADLLDIGGESTRPGAADVAVADEIQRVVPLLEALRASGVPLSVDTSKPEVMRAALAAGASIINDVRALQADGALAELVQSDCGIVLMHMRGTPRTMQEAPSYADVTQEVAEFLGERLAESRAAGIDAQRLVVDPGFGFGKTVEHNFTLLRELGRLTGLGAPLAVGLSRKSMLGAASGRAVDERVHASVAAAVLALERGARLLRVHDVAATRDAVRVWQAMGNDVEQGEQA